MDAPKLPIKNTEKTASNLTSRSQIIPPVVSRKPAVPPLSRPIASSGVVPPPQKSIPTIPKSTPAHPKPFQTQPRVVNYAKAEQRPVPPAERFVQPKTDVAQKPNETVKEQPKTQRPNKILSSAEIKAKKIKKFIIASVCVVLGAVIVLTFVGIMFPREEVESICNTRFLF